MPVSSWRPPSLDLSPDAVSSALSAEASAAANSVRDEKGGEQLVPSVTNVESVWSAIRQEAFLKGYQEGLEKGRAAGLSIGESEGREQGRSAGYKDGYQVGFADATMKIQHVADELAKIIAVLNAMPADLRDDLVELTYETSVRLFGRTGVDREAIEKAIVDSLGELPVAGVDIALRVPFEDMAAWEHVLGSTSHNDGRPHLTADTGLSAGQAFLEVKGVRIDVSSGARHALVRRALGLMSKPTSELTDRVG